MLTAPIPLSAGFENGLSRDLLHAALAAVRTVVAPSGPWPNGALRLADAVLWKAGIDLDLGMLAPASPVETAAAVTVPVLRIQLVRLAIVAAMMDGRPDAVLAAR